MVASSDHQTPEDVKRRLQAIGEAAQASFAQTHEVREQALRLSREATRNSANSIRATHRGEFEGAQQLLDEVAAIAKRIDGLLKDHPWVYYAGYVEDALKEYAEASATLSFARASKVAGPRELGIGPGPYLNGLAEAVGELRRSILDSIRKDDLSRCEELLEIMDEVYTILVTMDFPDAVTRGLRRSTDMARGVLERTRGDLTLALGQQRLERRLASFRQDLADRLGDDPRG